MNLHPLSTAELRSNMIAILNEVHSFCEENHLRYLLAFGTLLGAVRHKGFIPWDDDIDIWMPRKDYDLFEATFQHPFLQVLSAEKDHNYPLDFMKVHDTRTIVKEKGGDGEWGIFIDIFPLDDFPSSQVWKIACK